MEDKTELWIVTIVGIVAIAAIALMFISSAGSNKIVSASSSPDAANSAGLAGGGGDGAPPEACYSRCLRITGTPPYDKTDISYCCSVCGLGNGRNGIC